MILNTAGSVHTLFLVVTGRNVALRMLLSPGKKTAESEPENPRTVIIVYVKYRSLGSLVVVNSIKNISPIQI